MDVDHMAREILGIVSRFKNPPITTKLTFDVRQQSKISR